MRKCLFATMFHLERFGKKLISYKGFKNSCSNYTFHSALSLSSKLHLICNNLMSGPIIIVVNLCKNTFSTECCWTGSPCLCLDVHWYIMTLKAFIQVCGIAIIILLSLPLQSVLTANPFYLHSKVWNMNVGKVYFIANMHVQTIDKKNYTMLPFHSPFFKRC